MSYGKILLHGTRLRVRRLLKSDKRLFSFGFFLLASVALWTLNKFSNVYSHELSAQIELVTPNPVDYVITSSSVTQAQLLVRAHGYDLMKYKLFAGKKFRVSVTPTERNVNNASSIATAQLRSTIAQLLGVNYELLSISPDSITLQVARVVAKKVPVRSDFRISYAPQYMQQGAVLLTPDSVEVSGAEDSVQSVSEIYTKPLVKDKLTAKLSGKVDLIAPPQMFLSHRRVAYSINVQRFVETSYELPIHILDVPDSLSVSTLPSTAVVTFSVTMEKYPQLKREELYLTVSYDELSRSVSNHLHVELHNQPAYVLSTTITPSFVSVISMLKP